MIFSKIFLLLLSVITVVYSKDLFDSDIFDKLKNEMDNSDIFDRMQSEMDNSDIFDRMKNEMNNSDIFDKMKKEMENSDIFDKMKKEMENSDIYDKLQNQMNGSNTTATTNKIITNKVFTYSNTFTILDVTYVVGTKTYHPKKVSTVKNHSILTISSNDKCGSQSDGVYICKNNKCCNKYGKCGTGSNYCSTGCKPNYGKCN
ncbi:carbohydrate-binding module family 18 protein [Piromyces sp. E2]|nr:carbohydrate-binding module family 18 protein [Piromyces sp. E2]|eukprot:OUM58770.1 carbohydrate-binding module family 18 protein [Piromyces sp. E2]